MHTNNSKWWNVSAYERRDRFKNMDDIIVGCLMMMTWCFPKKFPFQLLILCPHACRKSHKTFKASVAKLVTMVKWIFCVLFILKRKLSLVIKDRKWKGLLKRNFRVSVLNGKLWSLFFEILSQFVFLTSTRDEVIHANICSCNECSTGLWIYEGTTKQLYASS